MSVTISDVASKAGVSTSTVSKVINNNPTISAETTARVNAAIKELHYIPNSRAVSFAKGQAKNIVYLSTLGKDIAYENPHMFDIMCGVYHELTSHHYMMSLVDTSEESYPGERAIVEIKKRSADGLIIHGSIVNETLAKHLLEEEIPHIIIGHPDFETRLCWIDTDHTLAGEYAADHICECGYTNVFFIAGRRNDVISNQRLKGFKKGMIHHKEYITRENIGYTNNTQEGAYEVTRNMLQKLPKKNFFMNWICLRNSTKRLPYMEETVPVSVFCMNQSLFIWQPFVIFTAEIWMRLLQIFRKYTQKFLII